jgi:hypothetical protein
MPNESAPVGDQTPAAGGPVADMFDVDSLIDRYVDGEGTSETATSDEDAETPAADTDTPAGRREPVEAGEDTPEDDDEGEDTGVEDDPDETDETHEDDDLDALLEGTEDDEPEDTPDESFLPPFDKVKFLKEHPELEAPYKHMQAAFTRSMTEAAKVRKQSEAKAAEADGMQKKYEEFQQQLQGDETFEEFLVQVSLNRPEVMERAYERALALSEDEGKRKEYEQGRELAETKKQLKDREQREQVQHLRQRTGEIVNLTQRVAKKLGLSGQGDLEVAEQYVANQILQNHADNGKRDISNEQIVVAVRRAAKALAREKEAARKTAKAEVRKEGLKAAQERARSPARPAPPRPGAAPAARTAPKAERVDNRPKQNALDSFIDGHLGVDD